MILWMWVPFEVSPDLDLDQPSTSTSESNVIWTEGAPLRIALMLLDRY